MRDQLEARLAELETEFEIGERRWHEIDAQQANLRETLMRISGAIQVLRELLDGQGSSAGAGAESGAVSVDGHAAPAGISRE